jgi:hypothetical protein
MSVNDNEDVLSDADTDIVDVRSSLDNGSSESGAGVEVELREVVEQQASPIKWKHRLPNQNNLYIYDIFKRLNRTIGYYRKKNYISSCFWSSLTWPINLAITIITALTTGEALAHNILDHTTFLRLSYTVLIVTTLNTFLRPHAQMAQYTDQMKSWILLESEFQTLIHNPRRRLRLTRYTELLRKQEEIRRKDQHSLVSDILYSITFYFDHRKKKTPYLVSTKGRHPEWLLSI